MSYLSRGDLKIVNHVRPSGTKSSPLDLRERPSDHAFDLMAPADDADPSAASQIREMRARLGWSQQLAARHAGVSVSTIKRLERRGVGHNQRRVSAALENALAEPAPGRGPTPRDVVDSFVASSGEPPSIMVREFLAFLETLSVEQQWAAVRTFALTVTSLARARGEIVGPVEGKDD